NVHWEADEVSGLGRTYGGVRLDARGLTPSGERAREAPGQIRAVVQDPMDDSAIAAGLPSPAHRRRRRRPSRGDETVQAYETLLDVSHIDFSFFDPNIPMISGNLFLVKAKPHPIKRVLETKRSGPRWQPNLKPIVNNASLPKTFQKMFPENKNI